MALAGALLAGVLVGACGSRPVPSAETEAWTGTTDELPSFAALAGTWVDPEPGDCPSLMKVFDPEAASLPDDLETQQAQARALEERSWGSFTVEYARPTHLGLVVLVAGDLGRARDALAAEGVTLVAEYGAQDDLESGIDVEHEVALVVSDQLRPLSDLVRRRTSHVGGRGAIATWPDAGAVLVQWKEPIPESVLALEALRPESGATVIVEGVPYSERELVRAQATLIDLLEGRDDPVTQVGRCGDGTGLVVGIEPDALDRAEQLRETYAAWVGFPVTVIGSPAFTES